MQGFARGAADGECDYSRFLDSTAIVTDTISLVRVCGEGRCGVVSSVTGRMEGKKEGRI